MVVFQFIDLKQQLYEKLGCKTEQVVRVKFRSNMAMRTIVQIANITTLLGLLPVVHLDQLSEDDQNCPICLDPFYGRERFEYTARLR